MRCVYPWGVAGDLAASEGRGIKAGDILLRFPPAAFKSLENRRWESSIFGPFHRDLRPRFRGGQLSAATNPIPFYSMLHHLFPPAA